jgi:catechol 2,3-dioxygenase-like lactoylglutathione lyase family enzyme
MKPGDCYHVGLVVADIATAAARFTAAAGYRWTTPVEATLSVTTADGDVEVPFSFVYSVDAPHLELIREVPGTIWTAPPGGAAHHLGYWVDDLDAAAAQLEQAGYKLEARPAGDALSMFAYFTDPAGVRIEIVDRALFPDWPGFLKSMTA